MHLLGIVCQKQSLTSLCYKHSVQILTSSFFQCLFCLSFFQSSIRLPVHADCYETEKSKTVQEQWTPQNIVGDMYFSISCI